MRRVSCITDRVTVDDVKAAILGAADGHLSKPEIKEALADVDGLAGHLYGMYRDGSYLEKLEYRQLTKVNNNGKVRPINSPVRDTRILEHLANNLIWPAYNSKDNGNGLNCKAGAGITARDDVSWY